jgi:UPF0755 protein
MKSILTLLLLTLLIAAGAGAYILLTPYGPTSETFVEVAPGSSTHAIAVQMQRSGIIRTQYAFAALRSYREFKNLPGTLKAGEYRFDHPATPSEIYARLLRGDVYTKALTIPEGYNIFDIAQAVETAGFAPRADFLAAERANTSLISDFSPNAVSLEGYLFPDTYHLSRHATPLQILTTMTHRFRQVAGQLNLHADHVAHTVLMASLIEKEVRQDSERPLVAGVFVNRLAQGIPLATDPTVIYAALLDDRWRGTIYASDLANPSLYNTYRHPGLPPGPIANPGIAALQAAIHPAKTDYLYFVADANGHSRFSATLKDHNSNVQAYRDAVKAAH